jgi:hypothetical protein
VCFTGKKTPALPDIDTSRAGFKRQRSSMNKVLKIIMGMAGVAIMLSGCQKGSGNQTQAANDRGTAIGGDGIVVSPDISVQNGSQSAPNKWSITVQVFDTAHDPLPARVEIVERAGNRKIVDTETNPDGTLAVPNLEDGDYDVTVSREGYESKTAWFNQHSRAELPVELTPIIRQEPFPVSGWSAWGGLSATSLNNNTVVLNGRVSIAGYVNEHIQTAVAGRTIILEIENAGASRFNDKRLLKITANRTDTLLKPDNILSLLSGEYIPSTSTRIEFTLPDNFDGKLGFVFYEAELHDLRITAFIR